MEQYGKEAESKAKEAKAELEKQANKTGRDLQGAVDKFDKNVEEVSLCLTFVKVGEGGSERERLRLLRGLIGLWSRATMAIFPWGFVVCCERCLLTFVSFCRAPARPRAPSRAGSEESKLFAMRGQHIGGKGQGSLVESCGMAMVGSRYIWQ